MDSTVRVSRPGSNSIFYSFQNLPKLPSSLKWLESITSIQRRVLRMSRVMPLLPPCLQGVPREDLISQNFNHLSTSLYMIEDSDVNEERQITEMKQSAHDALLFHVNALSEVTLQELKSCSIYIYFFLFRRCLVNVKLQ